MKNKQILLFLMMPIFCLASASEEKMVEPNIFKKQFVSDSKTKGNLVNKEFFNKLEYKKALNFYKNKKYEKAYLAFLDLFLNNMDNILINYYLGRSAYETKRYEFAIAAYDRILIKENNSRVRLELAQTYKKMELYPQALKEFEVVLKSKIPLNVRKKVIDSINFLKDKEKKHYFNTTALMSFMYDSNIDTTADVRNFDLYSPILNSTVNLPNDQNKQGTTILQLLATLSYKYKANEEFILDTSLTPLMLKYNNHKNKDIGAFSLNISPTYYMKDSIYSLALLYDYIYLGHEKYQRNFFINPKYTKMLNKKSMLELGLKRGRINYIKDEDKDKNADSLEFSGNYKYASKDFGIFSFGLILGKEKERVDTRTDVSNDYYNLTLSNTYGLPSNYNIQTQFSYKNIHYKEEDLNFLSKREDIKKDYSLGISKMVKKNFMIGLSGIYTNNSSNQVLYDYDKYIIKTDFIYSF